MKKSTKQKITAVILSILLILPIVNACSNNNEPILEPLNINWGFYNDKAILFTTLMVNGELDRALTMLNEDMAKVMNTDKLQEFWLLTTTAAGEFISIHDIENQFVEGYYLTSVILQHQVTGFSWNIFFDEAGLIAGLRTGGTQVITALTDYITEPIKRNGFTDYPVIIGEGTRFPLNGILSLPDTDNKVPAVIIVHGSGAHDMDGTIGPNKPYRDIADFLASNGIAVMRYEKRTFIYGIQMMQELGGKQTVREEVIEDAVLATELLRANSRIDENKVFIIGHSLGGLLAPRIYTEVGNFAGMILLAGTTRTLTEAIYDQGKMQVELLTDGSDKELGLSQLAELRDFIDSFPGMSDEEAQNTFFLGMSAHYLNEVAANPFEKNIQNINVPMLIMQGGSDFQILPDLDFLLLKDLLGKRDNVTFKQYDNLNHSFMFTTATNFNEHASSIMEPGHVDKTVLQDIVNWIKSQ